MANSKISQLPDAIVPLEDEDYIPVVQGIGNERSTNKVKVSDLKQSVQNEAPDLSNLVTLSTSQTISGAKVFSSIIKVDGGAELNTLYLPPNTADPGVSSNKTIYNLNNDIVIGGLGKKLTLKTNTASNILTLDLPITSGRLALTSDFSDRFKGKYTSLSALETAYPIANAGDYAQVDEGAEFDVVNYNWDSEDGWVKGGSGSATNQTDEYLLARANHTGEQAISTVTGLENSLINKANLEGDNTFSGLQTFSSFPKISAGTSGRIPYFTTGGQLTDHNLFNFNGTTLAGPGFYTNAFGALLSGNTVIGNNGTLEVNNGGGGPIIKQTGVPGGDGWVWRGNVLGYNSVNALFWTTAGMVGLSQTPTTSAGGYDILTRNTSTGIIEKTPASTFLTSYNETDPIYTASSWYSTTNNAANWNAAYGWGNHASAGYALASSLGSAAYLNANTAALNGDVVRRTADGDIFGRYFSMTGGVESGLISSFIGANNTSDGYIRRYTIGAAQASLGLGSNAYLSGYILGEYISGGLELPSYFGSNKLKLNMLRPSETNWADTLWMSSYAGGDVKLSNQLVFSKIATVAGFRQQDYDSETWGTFYEFYHSGNIPTLLSAVGLGNYALLSGATFTGTLSGTSATFSGALTTGSGIDGGVKSSNYVSGYNNIWTFTNSPEYGIAYYQGAGAIPITGNDAIGFHLGDQLVPLFYVRNSGLAFFTGTVTAPTFIGNLSGNSDGATKLISVSHPNDYWLTNTWDGTYWQLTSNHGASVKVGHANFSDGATVLETARTLWGQSFDGSANISGELTGVTDITSSGIISAVELLNATTGVSLTSTNIYSHRITSADSTYVQLELATSTGIKAYIEATDDYYGTLNKTGGTYLWTVQQSGNFAIGYGGSNADQGYKLAVNGTGYFAGYLTAAAGAGTSDIRAKELEDFNLDLSWLDTDRTIAFKFKDRRLGDRVQYGYSAQEIEAWNSDLIFDGKEKSLNQVELLTLEIKRLKQRVSELEVTA